MSCACAEFDATPAASATASAARAEDFFRTETAMAATPSHRAAPWAAILEQGLTDSRCRQGEWDCQVWVQVWGRKRWGSVAGVKPHKVQPGLGKQICGVQSASGTHGSTSGLQMPGPQTMQAPSGGQATSGWQGVDKVPSSLGAQLLPYFSSK